MKLRELLRDFKFTNDCTEIEVTYRPFEDGDNMIIEEEQSLDRKVIEWSFNGNTLCIEVK